MKLKQCLKIFQRQKCRTTWLHRLLLLSHSVVSNSLWPHRLQHAKPPCPSLSLSFPKFMSTESVMPSKYFILCHSFLLLLQSFPTSESFPMSQLFPAGGQYWISQYWSFNFSLSPSNEYSGLIYFKIDCLTSLLPKALKSFLHHHSLLYDSALTSVHDYWLYYLCWQSNVSALETEHRNSDRFYFLGLPNHWGRWLKP